MNPNLKLNRVDRGETVWEGREKILSPSLSPGSAQILRRSLASGWRWVFVCAVLLVWVAPGHAADPNAEEAFRRAINPYSDQFYDYAEREFSRFIEGFPNSERIPEAVLYQAKSRYYLHQYDGVVDLLKKWIGSAGTLADEYRLLMAQAYMERGDYATAAATYEQLLRDFPSSKHRLEAAYGQAYAKFKSGDVATTIGLLGGTNSVFAESANGATNLTVVAQGYLLLAEAHNARRDYRAAEEALQQLGSRNPGAKIEWQRQYQLARTFIAAQKMDQALQLAGELVKLAASAGEPLLEAQSLRLKAEILEVTKPEEAAAIFERISHMDGISSGEHRKALLKLVELANDQNQITNAIQRMETYITQNPGDLSMDVLRLNLGELNVKQFCALTGVPAEGSTVAEGSKRAGTPPPDAIRSLEAAQRQFDLIITNFPTSSYVGKAYFNRGWCNWEAAKLTNSPVLLAESEAAFRAATERFPRSSAQAQARFKWADCQYMRGDFAGAIRNYRTLIDQYADFPTVKDRFFEQALYQMVRAGIEAGNLTEAKHAVEQLNQWFRGGALGDRALLLFGQALVEARQFSAARECFQWLLDGWPKSPLVPEVRRAVAQSYVREADWTSALSQYDQWLAQYTNHADRAQVEFDRAWVTYQAGSETNAYHLFTNYVAVHADSPLAPMAQYWVADFFYRQQDFAAAELNYQSPLLLRPTNSASLTLPYQARLMASYAAFKREGYGDARGYLTSLLEDRHCPEQFKPEALFLLGNIYTEEQPRGSTNALDRFAIAWVPFNRIVTQYPTNRLVPQAWGRLGDCALQLGTMETRRYSEATNAYQKSLDCPWADVSVRSQAEVGLGLALEKMAEGKSGAAREGLLQQALDHYLSVVYGNRVRADVGEEPDPYWVSRAGMAACQLAEGSDRKEEAARLYRRLMELVPSMRAIWQRKLDALNLPLKTAQRDAGQI